jgi:hypothetical protein
MRNALDMYQVAFTRAADAIRGTGAFGAPEQWRFDWEQTYTRDEWLDQLPTQGALTRLSPEQLAPVLEAVGSAIDELGGSITMPYITMVVTAARA